MGKKNNLKKDRFWFLVLCFFAPPVGIEHCTKMCMNAGEEDIDGTCLKVSLLGLMMWCIVFGMIAVFALIAWFAISVFLKNT